NGVLVAPGDAAALADAIARVLREPGLARGLAQRGLARAANEFDWLAVMARHEAALGRAMAS
ncbi:MAG TPA: glycosyltransferase family 1 protein, partial [Ramlibacter sp.]|nr:glycosyltransferase family 1 protein [Ramlibacter sp.]